MRSRTLFAVAALGLMACSWLAAPGPAAAAIDNATVQDQLAFVQTGPTTVQPAGSANGLFFAIVDGDAPGDFDGGSFTVPGMAASISFNDFCGDGSCADYYDLDTASNIANSFPSGTYTLTVTNSATSSSQSIQVQYYSDMIPSTIPQFTASSFTALQNAPAGEPITLNFNSFTADPRSNAAYFNINLIDLTNGTNTLLTSNEPSITSYVLPSNTLTAGDQYQLSLYFINYIGESGSPLPFTVALDSTTINFTAVPEPATWAMLLTGFAALGATMRLRRRAVRA